MEHTKRVVIIGAGYAGLLTALRLSRQTAKQPVEIILVNGTDHFVERIRLHQVAAHQPLPRYNIADFVAGTRVQFRQAWVTALNPQQQYLTLQTATGHEILSYNYLIYALGSTVDTQAVPGLADHAFTLGSEQSAIAIRQKLLSIAARRGRLLVCGGGLTGIEAATELAESYPGLQVSLVTRGLLGQDLSAKGQRYLRQTFAHLGVTVLENRHVSQIQANQVECADGSTLPFDLCLWAGPFTVPSLGREAGLLVNQLGQVMVDAHLQVLNQPHIWAIGDAATLEHALTLPIRMACATAIPMATYVADNLTALLQGKPQLSPYQFRYFLQCISLGRHSGLLQWVRADDTPVEHIITGWLGARIKEGLCRSTIWRMNWERRRQIPWGSHRAAPKLTPIPN